MKEKCIKCGESREAIKKQEMICGGVDPQTGELMEEYGRHRYKPWSEKEIKNQERVEEAIQEQMGDMAEFVKQQ